MRRHRTPAAAWRRLVVIPRRERPSTTTRRAQDPTISPCCMPTGRRVTARVGSPRSLVRTPRDRAASASLRRHQPRRAPPRAIPDRTSPQTTRHSSLQLRPAAWSRTTMRPCSTRAGHLEGRRRHRRARALLRPRAARRYLPREDAAPGSRVVSQSGVVRSGATPRTARLRVADRARRREARWWSGPHRLAAAVSPAHLPRPDPWAYS